MTAFLTAIPEAHDKWWPDFLSQQVAGTIYPWSNEAQLRSSNSYDLTLIPGRRPYATDPLFALGVETDFLTRDTAMFGPHFQLPVFLDTAASPKGTIAAFYKTAPMVGYRHIATGDTVNIPGHILQRPDLVMLLITKTDPVAPYTAQSALGFRTNLSIPEGDWYFPTITNLNNGFRFVCDREGAPVTMDPAANATSVWEFMSQAGTWKRTAVAAGAPETYTWQVLPALADTLRLYQITIQSTLTVVGKDTVRLQGQFKLDWGGSAIMGRAGRTSEAGFGDSHWWYALIPLTGLPFLVRRRRRALGAFVTLASVAALVSCGVGQIAMTMDESFDYTFTRMRFTTDPARPNEPLMELTNGAGETKLNAYRSEYWTYTTGAGGAKDSVRTSCTGTGDHQVHGERARLWRRREAADDGGRRSAGSPEPGLRARPAADGDGAAGTAAVARSRPARGGRPAGGRAEAGRGSRRRTPPCHVSPDFACAAG
ncbi:MAG: hypothetical protein IPK33_06300 [Gemmatimonadetes bacterium]|nr:hypothetical protein [Gemmatimonadota bacterium]